jgi:hypothetical protein
MPGNVIAGGWPIQPFDQSQRNRNRARHARSQFRQDFRPMHIRHLAWMRGFIRDLDQGIAVLG